MRKRKKRIDRLPVLFSAVILIAFVFSVRALNEFRKEFSVGAETTAQRSYEPETLTEDWQLILVNAENAVPEDYEPELTLLDNGQRVDSRMYPYLQEMFDDMRKEKIYPVVGEGYRTAEEQERMMEEKAEAYIHDGLPPKRAQKAAESEVAAVGHSEHQLGLAVDINADKSRSDNEDVYAWLDKNAYKYGFILRYPVNRTDITGIGYEPWHYRYVGREAAEYITANGLCLEEYVNSTAK